jgi:hypothetical protein
MRVRAHMAHATTISQLCVRLVVGCWYERARRFSMCWQSFFDEADKPEVKAQLPVVTKDILDGWIYGQTSSAQAQ